MSAIALELCLHTVGMNYINLLKDFFIMNKFIKMGATALFALFLVACKPDPAADFKKLEDWAQSNQQAQTDFQAAFQQKLLSGDVQQIEAAVKEFDANVDKLQKGLDALEIKSDEIKVLKTKMQDNLKLSVELVKDGVELMLKPDTVTPERATEVQEKTQKALQASDEVIKLRAELATKYGKK